MACTAKQFVELLNSWVGRNEKDGTHKMIIDLYNSKVPRARGYKVTYKDAWCMATLAAAAIKLAAEDICPIECSCGEAIKIAQNMGTWIENENRVPNIGDWCVYDWDDQAKDFRITDNKGYPEHIGGVVEVNAANGVFKVVEGNFSNAVKVRTLAINGQYIRGFIAPKYSAEPVVAPVPAPAPTTNPTRKGVKYKMKTLRKGSTGNQVTIFETIMKELGYYKGAIDIEFGSGCVAACNAFQNDYPECGTNGKPDNTWGPKCWNKLFSLIGA